MRGARTNMRFSKTYLGVLLAMLLAFALRVYLLDGFSLRGDESFTVLFVQKPLAQMWQETLTVEPNPPLLYFLLRAWIQLTGDGEFATRFFSVVFGVLCVPLVYRLAREVFAGVTLTPLMRSDDALSKDTRVGAHSPSPKGRGGLEGRAIGLIAGFLVAINPYQIWHSQDVRNYTLWPALTLLALIFFFQWYNRTRRRNPSWLPPNSARLPTTPSPLPSDPAWLPLGLFVIAELAALYAHYYEAFALVALNLFVFATVWRDRRTLVQWIGSQVVLALLYLPYPLILSNRVSSYGEGSGRMGVALWDVARETFTAFVLGDTLDAAWRAWLWVPFLAIVLVGLGVMFRRARNRSLFFVLYLGIPTLAVFALNTVRPLYLERYLNGIAPVCYLLLAYGIVQISGLVARGNASAPVATNRAVRIGLVALCALVSLVALFNYWTNPAYAKAPDWRGLANVINTNAQTGDIILQNFPETSLVYYDRTELPLVMYPETYFADEATDRSLKTLNQDQQRVWFVPSAGGYWDPDEYVETWLNRRADLQREWHIGDFRLRLYSTPANFQDTMRQSGAEFGELLSLSGYRTTFDGDALKVALYWQVLKKPRENFEMRVQLVEPGKGVVAKVVQLPVWGEYPTTEWRKKELIVDQYDFGNVPTATQLLVSVCHVETDSCLPVGEAAGQAALTLPIQP